MPWSVVKRNQQFCVVRSDTGKTVLCHDTRKEATDHMAALYANEKKQVEQLAVATELLRGHPLLKTSMAPSIAELEIALATAETNAPINTAEGNPEQAHIEQRNAESFRQAIQLLKDGKSLSVGQRLEIKLLLKAYQKENPNRDEHGRFASGDGGGDSAGKTESAHNAETAKTAADHRTAKDYHDKLAKEETDKTTREAHQHAAELHQLASEFITDRAQGPNTRMMAESARSASERANKLLKKS